MVVPEVTNTLHPALAVATFASERRRRYIEEINDHLLLLQTEELGWNHYEGRSFRGLEPPCVHGAGLLRVYRRRALQGFPPSPEKLPRGKRRIGHDGAGRQPARSGPLPDSFITVAPGRRARPGHMVTRMRPVSQTANRWDRLVHMPVNTDGRLPFDISSAKVYLQAVLDNYSRKILAWTVTERFAPSNTCQVLLALASIS